ncbi:hypothetical protein NM528_20495 [Shewanella algae]|uniref:Uncharacterized protein n=3 Tax=Bacteria TaxID=2 RepID=A0AAU6VZ04_UNCXX
MMPTHRDYFDYSYFFPASIIAD